MTFPLPPAEAAFVSELQRLLDARMVDDEPEPDAAPNLFRIPARAQQELDAQVEHIWRFASNGTRSCGRCGLISSPGEVAGHYDSPLCYEAA